MNSLFQPAQGQRWLRDQREKDLRPLSQLLANRRLKPEDLLELAVCDVFECWRIGSGRPVETYLADFPELSQRKEFVLDLIDAEVCARREMKETVHIEEMMERFPALKENLERMLDLDHAEENLMRMVHQPVSLHDRSLDLSVDVALSAQTRSGDKISIDGQSITVPDGIRIVNMVASRPGVQLFRAVTKEDHRPVAVKTIRQSLADQRPAEDWINRLELASKLRNPRFVAAQMAIADLHHFVVVREWVEGLTWSEWTARNAPPEQLLKPLVGIADAMQTAHTAGLPHGHLHPGNLIIDHNGAPHITDLGCGAVASHAHDWRPVADDPRSADSTELRLRDLYAIAALTLAILERQGIATAPRWRPLHAVMQQARATPRVVIAELLGEAIRRSLDGRKIDVIGGKPSWVRRLWGGN
jgi:hypothetical protein